MEIKEKSFPVIGETRYNNQLGWAVMGPSRTVVRFEYHPAFKALFPKNSLFPCRITLSREGVKYDVNWAAIYSTLYEKNAICSFRAFSTTEDAVTFKKTLLVKDKYGFIFKLKQPTKKDLNLIGSDIKCRVRDITDKGLDLVSTFIEDAAYDVKPLQDNELFNKLHDAREKDFKTFNKRSFRGVWKSIIDKYPDTAHFIYELLQNADDAEATEVTILLGRDAMIFKHNGAVHFSVTDEDNDEITPGHINSITGMGDSTKEDGSNRIGKFGIGFKSIFQYTEAPEIYDDYFKFRIRNYIVPEQLEGDHINREKGETLFYIPFKDPETAYTEISSKLKELSNATLFLNYLKSIKWKNLVTTASYEYGKTIDESYTSCRGVTVERITLSDRKGEKKMLMFSRSIKVGNEGYHKINVGYYLTSTGAINTNVRPYLHCFFPTSESFDLCMIMHAPFLLVDNRQQIKLKEKTNIFLVKELGNLAADSLCEIRDLGIKDGKLMLNGNIAQILQLEEEYNPYVLQYAKKDEALIRSMSIIDPCVKRFKSEALLLSSDDRYLCSGDIYHIKPISLATLLNASQLKSLRCTDRPLGILCPSLNELDIETLEEDVDINTYGTQDFAADITPEFMSGQSQQWINRLFGFLNKEARSSWLIEEKNPYFLYVPIIENSKGEWVSPFYDGRINVFSAGDPEEYNIVSPNMLASHQAQKFLKEIGCKEPDQLDYINTHILEKYLTASTIVDDDSLLSDFKIVIKYYYSSSIDSREQMMEKARRSLQLSCIDENGNISTLRPDSIYLDTDDLKLYFNGLADVFFFNQSFYLDVIREFGKEKVHNFLESLGILIYPRVIEQNDRWASALTQHQKEQIEYATTKTTSYTINDKHLEGLENALNKPNKELSHCIWRVISPLDLNSFRSGEFNYFYRTSHKRLFDSSAIESLRNNPWICIDGKIHTPSEVSLEQFEKEGYPINYEFCKLLGINRKELDLVAAGASKELIHQAQMGKLLDEAGVTEEYIPDYIEYFRKKVATKRAKEAKESQSDFLSTDRPALQAMGAEAFSGAMPTNTSVTPAEQKTSRNKERLQEQRDRVLNDLERNEEYELLREDVKEMTRYSKEWFEALLNLEYKNDIPRETKQYYKPISLSFGKVQRDPANERILILRNSSEPIPIEIETVDKIEVHFEFKNQEETHIAFDVASVRDFTLRLKAKATDIKAINKTDWGQCTRAVVNINNPTELIGKLITAFKGLGVEDGFNFKDNLRNNISFVFGPPGTGKTTFVANRISKILHDEDYCKILVLAPTNKACDVITEKIAASTNTHNWLGRFVATSSDVIEQNGLLINRDSELYEEDKCCIVSTIARLPYDGFVTPGGAPRLRELDWDYVIIDEASMIPLAQIVYAIYQFSPDSKIIIAGDPLQIPPIVNEEEWKNENIYSMVNLRQFDNPKTEPISFEITNLTTQYRSIPAIGEVFSRYSYGGLLRHDRGQNQQVPIEMPGLPMKSINYIEFKVEKYDNIFGPKKLAGSPVQIYSVLLVTEICQYICNQYKGDIAINVGVICPYVAESQMIDRLLDQLKSKPDNINFHVGTIHGFQGDECDIVFTVFNPPRGLSSHPKDIMLNRKDIINVAISRARDYLFILVPHPNTDGFNNLVELRQLTTIASKAVHEHIQYFSSDDIEEILFGKKFFLENNTFVTSHQMANVYTEPGMKYEVRIDDTAVDIQILE